MCNKNSVNLMLKKQSLILFEYDLSKINVMLFELHDV